MTRARVLVIDDDPLFRFRICNDLRGAGYVVAEAASSREARLQLANFRPDATVFSLNIPHTNAAELVDAVRDAALRIPIVLFTAEKGAPEFPQLPAYEGVICSLPKTAGIRALEQRLASALAVDQSRPQRDPRCRSRRDDLNPFLGNSPAIRQLERMAHRLLTSDSPILIQGETGSGKGVLANWIHRNGRRSQQALHDLNCAGLSRDLLESELFGHRKGSFTGALEHKIGLFEAANHGTLFLDEIGDVDLRVQSKLLKVLEEQRFRRLGEVQERTADVRLISATRCDLKRLVASGDFRVDLYYRINVVQIAIPPLRERVEDIALLARSLADTIAHECHREPLNIGVSAMEALQRHSWPGNIRELRNVLERAIQFSDHSTLTALDLHLETRAAPTPTGFLDVTDCSMTLKELQDAYIEQVLREEGGSVERAARRLGIARSSLYNKRKPSVIALTPMASA